jgi:hypothetical protein
MPAAELELPVELELLDDVTGEPWLVLDDPQPASPATTTAAVHEKQTVARSLPQPNELRARSRENSMGRVREQVQLPDQL